MINHTEIKCYGFSYNEVEAIIHQWDTSAEVEYEGGVVRARTVDENNGGIEYTDFAEILVEIHPELYVSTDAIAMYLDFGYIYPRHGAEVVVIEGIQE